MSSYLFFFSGKETYLFCTISISFGTCFCFTTVIGATLKNWASSFYWQGFDCVWDTIKKNKKKTWRLKVSNSKYVFDGQAFSGCYMPEKESSCFIPMFTLSGMRQRRCESRRGRQTFLVAVLLDIIFLNIIFLLAFYSSHVRASCFWYRIAPPKFGTCLTRTEYGLLPYKKNDAAHFFTVIELSWQ